MIITSSLLLNCFIFCFDKLRGETSGELKEEFA